jgi:hypothetical protein
VLGEVHPLRQGGHGLIALEQVAEEPGPTPLGLLVANGLTDAEIAAQLFTS